MVRRKIEVSEVEAIRTAEIEALDIVCLSHLKWNFVFQRPQHLMTRFARNGRVFYIEEPEIDEGPSCLIVNRDASGVWVAVPHLAKNLSKVEGRAAHQDLISKLFTEYNLLQPVLWYYTPMAIDYTRHLSSCLVVYDCMDELSAFVNAPPKMKELEAELIRTADIIFTGGQSLYEAKRNSHPRVYAFPSSIDQNHFCSARASQQDPADQAHIPHPRLGFFGVIDERMDLGLIGAIADARPDWQLVMIGPVAKIRQSNLPHRANIHYLGKKEYRDLPAYLAGWDVALLPFAQNESTRFISPTKTPEYLAGGRPVVSTPIRDVVRPYGENGLVWIADTVAQFIRSIETALDLNGNKTHWLKRVDAFLAQNSWDKTWQEMRRLIKETACNRSTSLPSSVIAVQTSLEAQSVSLPTLPFNSSLSSRGNGGLAAFDYLIVGAGFAGSVMAERLACGSGKKILLIDRRPHIGGNAYDHYDQAGILVHKYGPHIFHTNSREVFTYLSSFTEWRPYEHRVRASVDGQLVPMPINLDTINRLYGLSLTSFELEKFFDSIAEPVDQIRTSEDVVVSKVGRQLYEKFFRNYTRKQWDLDPSELDSSVTSRVPIRMNRDDRYFTDTYQAMPLYGYTRMFENLLDHPNIRIMLNTEYKDILDYVSFNEVIFTGPVDEYFNYCYGKLPYRSLHFKFETMNEELHQPVAVINYPNEHAYTRVTEFKHLTGQQHPKTSLVYEYPCSEGDPYYPIPRPENAELYKKYKTLADAVPDVYFAGRLATYKYYNMDQVVAQALTLYSRLAGVRRIESASTYTNNKFFVDIPCNLLLNENSD